MTGATTEDLERAVHVEADDLVPHTASTREAPAAAAYCWEDGTPALALAVGDVVGGGGDQFGVVVARKPESGSLVKFPGQDGVGEGVPLVGADD